MARKPLKLREKMIAVAPPTNTFRETRIGAAVEPGAAAFFSTAANFGADTVVKHYLLRWLLHSHRILPAFPRDRTLISFLDQMAERIVLRRVGGGWQFAHRYLLEYFTSLTPAEMQQLAE